MHDAAIEGMIVPASSSCIPSRQGHSQLRIWSKTTSRFVSRSSDASSEHKPARTKHWLLSPEAPTQRLALQSDLLMSEVLRKNKLSRRTVLKGVGVAIALPWLDAMLPAMANQAEAAEAAAPKRFLAINYGLGFHGPHFFPKEVGADYVASNYLKRVEQHRAHFSVISGLSHVDQNGANGHTSELTILTAAKHPGLPGFKNSISFDQYLVEKLVPDTRFPSLQLNVGSRDSLSWSSNGVNLPAEDSPSKLFQLMFVTGSAKEIEQQVTELQRGRSVLDAVNERAKQLQGTLGARDREKFDQYLTSVRELERRLQASDSWARKPKPTVDATQPKDIPDRMDIVARSRLMYEMVALALQSDSTRFITVKGNATNDVPKVTGVSTGWHDLSHHGQDDKKIDELQLIEGAEFSAIDHLLTLLRQGKDATGPVLDSTQVLITSNLGNASSHSWRDLPVLLAGGGYRHGQHVVAGRSGLDNARFCNLFVQMAQKLGVETERFGTNDGTSVKGFA